MTVWYNEELDEIKLLLCIPKYPGKTTEFYGYLYTYIGDFE